MYKIKNENKICYFLLNIRNISNKHILFLKVLLKRESMLEMIAGLNPYIVSVENLVDYKAFNYTCIINLIYCKL